MKSVINNINRIMIICLIFIVSIVIFEKKVYARDPDAFDKNITTDTSIKGDSSTGLPQLDGGYKPSANLGGTSKNIVVTILNILTVLGIVAVVIGIALVGFGTILGSASEKAIAKEKYVGLLIAAIVITAGSTIAKVLVKVAENL